MHPPTRRPLHAVALSFLVFGVAWIGAPPAAAQHPDPLDIPPRAPGPGGVPTRAWILADADTGRVLVGEHHHQPLPPASTTKLMTALVALEKLPLDATFVVAERPASQAAMRIGMHPGQSWKLEPALHALLMVSANDAAYAVAEAASRTGDSALVAACRRRWRS
jgi:D-alanyl-D-alanine carboxypeptidase (penicillin-binding protein 5/6)